MTRGEIETLATAHGATAGRRGLEGDADVEIALNALRLADPVRGVRIEGRRLAGRRLARAWLAGMGAGLAAWATGEAGR